MFVELNLNPQHKRKGDCSVRALAAAEDRSWYEIYDELYHIGREMGDMENSNDVIGQFLKERGYIRYSIPNTCPACYTVRDFANDHPEGIYVLGTGTHVVAVINGDYYDSWDSGDEVPVYCWRASL